MAGLCQGESRTNWGTDRTHPQRTWAIPSDAPARHAVPLLLFCGADDTARRWPWSRLTCHGFGRGFRGKMVDFYGHLW